MLSASLKRSMRHSTSLSRERATPSSRVAIKMMQNMVQQLTGRDSSSEYKRLRLNHWRRAHRVDAGSARLAFHDGALKHVLRLCFKKSKPDFCGSR